MKIWSNTNTLAGYIDDMDTAATPAEAEIALIGGKAIDIEQFPRLRGIFKCGIGRDNVPENQADERRILCGFPSPATAETIYEETACFSCHLVLRCLYTDIGDMQSWTKANRPALSEREVLVIGTGNIGKRVVQKLQGFAHVTAFDCAIHDPLALEPLVRRADCITLHIPLTSTNKGWFGAEKLGWMRDGTALVNTARAAIVPEMALYEELDHGRIRAAFDVFWQEPYHGKLMELPSDRFLATPHIASTNSQFLSMLADDFRMFLDAFA